jgi:beta-glucanase (GH16 family)
MKNIIVVFVSCLFFSLSAQDVYLWQVMKNKSIVVWGKSSGDEFMGNQLDESKWSYNFDWGKNGFGTGDYALKENLVVEGGVLKLIVKKGKFKMRGIPWMPDTSILADKLLNYREWDYSNAVLFSKKKYLYGIFECKFKAPAEVGSWPAFWIYTTYPNKEIDMYEGKGERIKDVHIDIHEPDERSGFGGWIRLDKPLNENFATVRAHWDSNLVMFYLNNQIVSHYYGKINMEGNLITNNSIVARKLSDNKLGDFLYPMDSTTKFPNELVLEYIRIWEKPNKYINRKSSSIIEKSTINFSDKTLGNIEKKMNLGTRKKLKFKRYGNQAQMEVNMEVLKDKRMLIFNVRGSKNEPISIKVEDSKGTVRFEVPELIASQYTFNTDYIGGNIFKVKLKFSNQVVEQIIDFNSGKD